MGRKTGGRDFKPGNKSSKGRPKLPKALVAARELGRGVVEMRVFELKTKTEKELQSLMSNPDTSVEDKLIIRVILRGIAKGDFQCLGFITDFVFGKRPDKIDIKNEGQPAQQVIVMLPPKDE